MKKFLIIGFTLLLFTFFSPETTSAQCCWDGGGRYVFREVTYVPVYRYRRYVRYRPRYRYPRRYRSGLSITFVARRRVYYPYARYRSAAWYW